MTDATHNDSERDAGASRELELASRDSSHSTLSKYPGGRAEVVDAAGRGRSFFDRLPWEKALIWGLIILAVYMMRGFFFTIFMTFMVSYVIRSVVMNVQRLISPYHERIWLERILTLACFALLLFGFFEAGRYIGPKLQEQAQGLYARVTHLDLQETYDEILVSTVGQILFERKYGDEDDQAYKDAFKEFQKNEEGLRFVDYKEFGKLRDSLEAFEAENRQRAAERVEQRIEEGSIRESEFEAWFRENKASEILAGDEEKWTRKWEQQFSALLGPDEIALLKSRPNFEETQRTAMINLIAKEWLEDEPQKREAAFEEWKKTVLIEAEIAAEAEQRFREKYEALHAEDPEHYPYDYETYVALRQAHDEGPAAFSALLRSIDDLTDTIREEELLRKQHLDFQLRERQKLTETWQEGEIFRRIQNYVNENLGGVLDGLESWATRTFRQVIALPAQVALVVLLSLFITLDFHKLRSGVHKLENSRVRNFYLEIAPGVINFGRLIGRAFLAQGVIALFNTLLTFLAIKALGIQNEYFLSTIVFLCSFIPVAGVVLSSAPIAIMALIQPGGDIWLALQAIVAILVIHFIETSLLNPKILGDMLHLHPVLVLTVLAIGQQFFGVWGLLLAVPVAVYIIRFVILSEGIPGLIEIEPARGGRPYEPEPAMPSAAGAPAGATESPEAEGAPEPTGADSAVRWAGAERTRL